MGMSELHIKLVWGGRRVEIAKERKKKKKEKKKMLPQKDKMTIYLNFWMTSYL